MIFGDRSHGPSHLDELADERGDRLGCILRQEVADTGQPCHRAVRPESLEHPDCHLGRDSPVLLAGDVHRGHVARVLEEQLESKYCRDMKEIVHGHMPSPWGIARSQEFKRLNLENQSTQQPCQSELSVALRDSIRRELGRILPRPSPQLARLSSTRQVGSSLNKTGRLVESPPEFNGGEASLKHWSPQQV